MRKRHKVAVGFFTTIIIIFMILTIFAIKGVILKQKIENDKLQEKLELFQKETDGKINELAIDLIYTKGIISNKFTTIDRDITTTKEKITELSTETNRDFSEIIKDSIESVVTVRTLTKKGSGFFVNNEGYVVTNTHAITNDLGRFSSLVQIITSDGEIHSAKIIGAIDEIDLSLLKIDSEYPGLTLANSNEVKKGENVIAIGNPEGLELSITDGIVSATKRVGINNLPYYIQTNTELNQGSSGGPLINQKGLVIGMNNFKILDKEGLGFALESNYIKKGVNQIGIEILNETIIKY